jgi:hypothetical protein
MKKVIFAGLLLASLGGLSSFTLKNDKAAAKHSVADKKNLGTADDKKNLGTADDKKNLGTADDKKNLGTADDKKNLGTAD